MSYHPISVGNTCRLQWEIHGGQNYIHRLPGLKKDIPQKITPSLDKSESGNGGLLTSAGLLDHIISRLRAGEACSVVSVGATEAFVMAQYTIYGETEINEHPEALIANQGRKAGFFHRGIRLPNREARDALVAAVRKADVVGYNTVVGSARELTERVFCTYSIQPAHCFEANLRRVIMFTQQDKFLEMLAGKRILLIGSCAINAKAALETRWQSSPPFSICGAIPVYEYEEIPWIINTLPLYDFDLALLSAGVNAVILASYISTALGKTAFDIGWGMESLISGEVITDPWINEEIGLENLYGM